MRTRKALASYASARKTCLHHETTCIQQHPIHRRIIAARVYLCVSSSSLFSSGVFATSYFVSFHRVSSSNRLRRILPIARTCFFLAVSYTSCRKSFLPDFAYPFNFDICRSQFRSALQNESRNVASSASCISFTAFRFLLAILKRVHENFNIFKKKLMKNKIFFWSLYISYFNVYRNFPTRSKSYAI